MAFDWRAYLELAQELAQRPSSSPLHEAAQRSAASRAYYAAFGCTRHWAVRRGFSPTGTARDHLLLREHLRRAGKLRLASRLNSLRIWRNLCDYANQVPNLNHVVRSSLHLARHVIQEVTESQKRP